VCGLRNRSAVGRGLGPMNFPQTKPPLRRTTEKPRCMRYGRRAVSVYGMLQTRQRPDGFRER
jgi:hypothetical protein